MELIGALRPWQGAGLAFAVALAISLAARLLGRPLPFGIAAGIGVLAGWWYELGLVTATPRQLPERLPLLVLGLMVLVAVLGAAVRRWRWLTLPAALLIALAAGWWMAGAPLILPDLQRAVPVLGAVAAGALLAALPAAPRWALPLAALALAAALLVAPPPGRAPVLAATLAAAALAASLVPPGRGVAVPPILAALPVAGAVVGLAAIPVLARGAPSDFVAAAAPFAVLWLGPLLGRRISRRGGPVLGAVLVGSAVTLVAFLLH